MKCNKIVCVDHEPTTNQMFFGDFGNYIRIDKLYYPQFKKLYEHSESNTWFMNEINYDKDIAGFKNLDDTAKRMFKLNICYQTLMDSGVTNIFDYVAQVANVSEIQYTYKRISIEESIHAMSYSNGLDVVFGHEANKILNIVYTDKQVQNRMENEVNGASDFITKAIINKQTDDKAKKSLLVLLAAAYLLEGVKFPFSFFVTWTINNSFNNSIQGFSRALKLIAHDEMTFHTVVGKTVLNLLRKDENQGFKHLFDNGWFDTMYNKLQLHTYQQELIWHKYLQQEGPIEGYNDEIGEHFIKYWLAYRAEDINSTIPFKEPKSDIIDWFNRYRNLNGTSTALQEAEATNYQKGKLQNDLDNFNIKDLECQM